MKPYKTYKATVEKPRLVIEHDEYSESPRNWSNLGYFITCERNRFSPDKNVELETIIKETGEEATSQEEHIKMITEQYQTATGYHIEAIYPIVKYEHGGVSYSLGTQHGFDYSNNGFYVITTETQKEVGVKKEDFEKVIKDELDLYNKWVNGEVYRFTLYDENGEEEDSRSGFYSIEEIREYLPKEWKNEDLEQYFKN